MSGMDEVLERFYRALVEEIESKRPEYLEGPFTVAEIYQNLVPYGTHRDRIGVEMNGDYEDALLRLLAGEGGFLRLESEHALRDLREELESSNPNTGLYREFAAVDVRLGTPDRDGGVDPASEAAPADFWGTAADAPVPDSRDAVSVDELAPSQEGEEPEPVGSAPAAAGSDAADACRWCRAELPHRANLNYCPFCGTDVHLVPCAACGEELDQDWRFCIACGAEVTG